MISPAEIAVARAVPVADVVGGFVPLKHDFGLCCFHDERTPSLHVHRASNTWRCFGCGAHGDTIEFIRLTKQLDFEAAVRELTNGWQPKGTRTQPTSLRYGASRTNIEVPLSVSRLWNEANAPELVTYYLSTRNLPQKPLPSALRGHRRVWCAETGDCRPAVLAAVSDAQDRITAVQRTYLTMRLEYDGKTTHDRGSRDPTLSAGKKCLGRLGSGAVKLAPAGEVTGLAEGVESALAAARLYRIPVWAACGSGRLGDVELATVVRSVVIFGDDDDAGRAAAAKAEASYRRRGYGVQSEFPDGARDFAAVLSK